VVFHVNAEAEESDAFGLEPHALFEAVFTGEKYLAAGADDALPWDAGTGSVECPCGLTGRSGETCGVGDVSVGCDLTVRDATDLGEDLLEHGAGHVPKITAWGGNISPPISGQRRFDTPISPRAWPRR
jgi:hypothetical protein